ncbi:MAG: hypothetical protein GY754_08390 [bacterium]|nr:hypothetical protein [bacterium]
MIEQKVKAKFKEFSLPETVSPEESCVVVPTVKGTLYLKYGKHAYYFYNYKTSQGFRVTISHKEILKIGLKRFIETSNKDQQDKSRFGFLFRKYHYKLSFMEQVGLLTTPHTVTPLGEGRFLINLWAYYGSILVDCNKKTARYMVLEKNDDHVLGSQQWYDKDSDELYYMTYSLEDSLKRCDDPYNKVLCKIYKHENKTGVSSEIWKGDFVDYIHDLIINETRQYCVIPEFGLFLDENKDLIPSNALVVDLKNKKDWQISDFQAAAHAQFDPLDPDIVYFSNHNIKMMSSTVLKYLLKGTYAIEIAGPASIPKYRLTENGPEKMGAFAHPEMFRITNIHVFMHRGRKILAAIGSPNFIFIADADDLTFIKKIEVTNEKCREHLFRKTPCIIGTITPSLDGEKMYVQSKNSFQIIDIASGKADWRRNYFFTHACTHHMITSNDTNW